MTNYTSTIVTLYLKQVQVIDGLESSGWVLSLAIIILLSNCKLIYSWNSSNDVFTSIYIISGYLNCLFLEQFSNLSS